MSRHHHLSAEPGHVHLGFWDGTLAPVSWVERFDWKSYSILLHAHNREHIAQVQRILSAPDSQSEGGG